MLKRIGLILTGMILCVLALGVSERVRGFVSKAGGGEASAAVVPLPTCSNASLNGNYLFTSNGFRSEAGPIEKEKFPYQMIGIVNFDGSGKLAATTLQRWGTDNNSSVAPLSGTYKILSDCRGTFTLNMSPKVVWSYTMVVGGNDVNFLATDIQAGAITGSMKKF